MTNMEQALIDAGIKPPSSLERVWRAVKEAGQLGITYKGLTKRLAALPPGTISSRLNDLQARGMVASQVMNGTKSHARPTFIYTTDMDEYQVLPKLGKKAKAPRAAKRAAPAPAPTPAAPPAPKVIQAPLLDSVDHLTIAQARALYDVLRRMFETSRR